MLLPRTCRSYAVRRAIVQTSTNFTSHVKSVHSSHVPEHSQKFQPFSIASALQDLVTTGRLNPDDSQQFAAQVLNALQDSVRQEAQASRSQSVSDKASQQLPVQNPEPPAPAALPCPRGAYLWGTIGSGKTMLLDLFCSSFSDSDRQQLGLCRLHFHEFMLTIHSRLHSLQQSVPRIKGQSQFGLPVYRSGIPSTPSKLLHLTHLAAHSMLKALCSGTASSLQSLRLALFFLLADINKHPCIMQIRTPARAPSGPGCSRHCKRHKGLVSG